MRLGNMRKASNDHSEYTGYAAEAINNGNLSHAIEYLQGLDNMGQIFGELLIIKERCPEDKFRAVLRSCFKRMK